MYNPTLSIPPGLVTMYLYRPTVNVQPHPVHSTWPGYNVPVLTNCQCTTPPCPFHLAWLQCTCSDQLSMYNPTLSIPPGLVTMYLYRPTVNVQPHPVHSTWPGYKVPVLTNYLRWARKHGSDFTCSICVLCEPLMCFTSCLICNVELT